MIQANWIIKAEDEAKLNEWLADEAGALISWGQDQEDQADGPLVNEGTLTIGKPFMVETVPVPVVLVTFKADTGKLKRTHWITPCILGGDEDSLETFDEDGDRLDGEAFDYGEVKDLPDLSAVQNAIDALGTFDHSCKCEEDDDDTAKGAEEGCPACQAYEAECALDSYIKAVTE